MKKIIGKKYNTQTSTKEANAMVKQMKKLKMLLEMIDKGSVDTLEELEVFYDKADIVDDNVGYAILTDMQFIISEKLIFINVTGMLPDEFEGGEDGLECLSKHLPLEIQNLENFDMDEELSEALRKMYIGAYGNPVGRRLVMDGSGNIFIQEDVDSCPYPDDVVFVHSENHPSGNDAVDIPYREDYLEENELEDTDENYDKFLKLFVHSFDFEYYIDCIIKEFHDTLEGKTITRQ